MEFPDLGSNCSEASCNLLDFLPMKCDACEKVFCKDHIAYTRHNCEKSYLKDVQVPVCPLCNKPVPVKRGEPPDVQVGMHIDNDCQSDSAVAKRKVYVNKCSFKGCKQKEVIPVVCTQCKQNFCLKHRHMIDHNCQGSDVRGRHISKLGSEANDQRQIGKNTSPSVHSNRALGSFSGIPMKLDPSSSQGNLTEDEALAWALQQSKLENNPRETVPANSMTEQEIEDHLLAQALAASEEDYHQHQQAQREREKSCTLS